MKSVNFSLGHNLVCPKYEESLKIDIVAKNNVIRIFQNVGLMLTCHQHVDNRPTKAQDTEIYVNQFNRGSSV